MMKLLFAMLSLMASEGWSQMPDVSMLSGHWVGSGRLYQVKMHEKCGPIAFDLRFDANRALTGNVGRARIAPAVPRIENKRVDYYTVLDSKVCPDDEDGKNHLVLLVTETSEKVFRADFHLKSSFGFDWSMHPGTLEARRQE